MRDERRDERCQHDMLEWPALGLSSCAICKKMPDVESLDFDVSDVVSFLNHRKPGRGLGIGWNRAVRQFEDAA